MRVVTACMGLKQLPEKHELASWSQNRHLTTDSCICAVPAPVTGPAKVPGDPGSATAAATAAARPPRAPREQTFVMPMLVPQQPVEPQVRLPACRD